MKHILLLFYCLSLSIPLAVIGQGTQTNNENWHLPKNELRQKALMHINVYQTYLHDYTLLDGKQNANKRNELKKQIISLFEGDTTIVETLNKGKGKKPTEHTIVDYLNQIAAREKITIKFPRDPVVIGEPTKVAGKNEYQVTVKMFQIYECGEYKDETIKVAIVKVVDEIVNNKKEKVIKIIRIDALSVK